MRRKVSALEQPGRSRPKGLTCTSWRAGEEGLERIKQQITAQADVHAHTHPVDVGNSKNLGRLLDACEEIDIVVNNAGGIRGGAIEAVDEAAWREGWDVKVYGFCQPDPLGVRGA